MNGKEIIKRIGAMMLTAVMALSMTGYVFEGAYAASENGGASEQTEAGAEYTGEAVTEAQPSEHAGESGAEAQPSEYAGESDTEAQPSEYAGNEDTDAEAAEADAEPLTEEPSSSEPDNTLMAAGLEAKEGADEIGRISVSASGDERYITAVWSQVPGAAYYIVSLDGDPAGARVEAGGALRYVFANVPEGSPHSVSVRAYKTVPAGQQGGEGSSSPDGSAALTEDKLIAEGSAQDIKSVIRSRLSSRTATAKKLGIKSLRELLGEGHSGYAVAQGACTDGTYAYYMLSSSSNQKGRVLKLRMSDNAVMARSPVALSTHHANGMTYDSKRHRLVAVGYSSWRQQLSFIDPDKLTMISQRNLNYPYSDMEAVKKGYSQNGIAAIAYIPKYDVYVARERGDHARGGINDIMIFDAETLSLIGSVRTSITAQYPETYQSMDADEKYVYFLLSAGSGQPYNIILALDWNSENLLPVLNGDTKYIKDIWYCGNDGKGKPDAVIRIPTSCEAEGLYHTTDAAGNSHFYLSEYQGKWKYKTVTKKKKIKKKWKKVWKKVKWKKVKKNGKWKWKYKKKKVWKYKIKYKKYKAKVKNYYSRENYVYDLGII